MAATNVPVENVVGAYAEGRDVQIARILACKRDRNLFIDNGFCLLLFSIDFVQKIRSIFILLHFHIPCKHIFPYKAAIMAYPKIERTLKMKLEMLEKLCSEMVENDYTMQHITFSWRQTDINILLAVDGDKYADILMGLSGYDRSGQSLSRLFSYHFERPCRSLFIPEEDYRFFTKIFDSLPKEKREGKGKAFEPFNLFSLIEGHLPEHPTQAAANKLFSDIFPPEVIKSSVEDADKIYFMKTNDHLIDRRHVSA